MNVRIREADLSDLETLVRWRMEVLREVFPPWYCTISDELEDENRNYYREAIPRGTHIPCFAYVEEEIAGCGGMCLYREMPSPDNPNGLCAYLMNIYTLPEFRRQGIGGAVVRWLVERAKKMEIPKIYLETSEPGRPLYERVGFHDLPDMMIMPRPTEKNL